MQIIKNVSKWGNGAGVLLPKEWVNQEVKIILIDRTLQIKKEVFNILDKYFTDILGIYLVGSYARGEQSERSDIDVLVISNKIKKEIKSGKYHISIITLSVAQNTLNKYPLLIYPRLIEAKTIINQKLLEELKSTKISKDSFREFVKDTKRIIKINEEFIKLDKLDGGKLLSDGILYSLILRLRGISIIKSILSNKKYSKKEFKKGLVKIISNEEYEKVYNVYTSVKDDKKIKADIKISVAEKLLDLLKKEIKKLGKK
jgi:predicted nucleotidyltransferase